MTDVMEGKYEVLGQADFDSADDANIPVNVFLCPSNPDEDDESKPLAGWMLTADNFMPRKEACTDQMYKFFSTDRAVLVHMVQQYWRPLYEVALELLKLEPREPDGSAHFYYWSKK